MLLFCLFSLKGILFSSVDCIKSTQDLVKLYLHEANRVYRDKLVDEKDSDLFDKIQIEVVKKIFDVSIALRIFLHLKNSDDYADNNQNDKYLVHKLEKVRDYIRKENSIFILLR